ncbi:hypothetical protein UB46_41300 [Burkholderiaceae bacterium 16]|nr:hypothetical protein UB46_41300 [Burkholderiaceae bacterium 16]
MSSVPRASPSYRLVSRPATRLLIFEALRVKATSARPKTTQDESGRWLRKQDRAKARLNSRILASVWGRTLTFAQYKAHLGHWSAAGLQRGHRLGGDGKGREALDPGGQDGDC